MIHAYDEHRAQSVACFPRSSKAHKYSLADQFSQQRQRISLVTIYQQNGAPLKQSLGSWVGLPSASITPPSDSKTPVLRAA